MGIGTEPGTGGTNPNAPVVPDPGVGPGNPGDGGITEPGAGPVNPNQNGTNAVVPAFQGLGNQFSFDQLFNLPMFGGPYSAPLVQPQLDALQAYRNLFSQQPAVTTQDLRSGIQMGLTGNPIYHPSFGQSFSQAIAPYSYDNSGQLDAAQQVFQGQLAKLLADTKERYSSVGNLTGSSQRDAGIAGAAGNALAQFNLGVENLRANEFQNAFNRFQGIYEPAAQRSTATLPLMFAAENLPYQRAQELYGLGEQARQVAQGDLQTQLAEYARTQGGLLNQLIALMSNTPLNNTAVGPSPLSQFGSLAGGAIDLFS